MTHPRTMGGIFDLPRRYRHKSDGRVTTAYRTSKAEQRQQGGHTLYIAAGEWVVTDARGDVYAVTDDDFQAYFEVVNDE